MFYKVVTKCGHVGAGKYIEIAFPTTARSSSEAAQKAKTFARVKKQLRYCISDCEEISEEEFQQLVITTTNDPYLSSKCKKDLYNIEGIEKRIQVLPSNNHFKSTNRSERLETNIKRRKYLHQYEKYGYKKLLMEEMI